MYTTATIQIESDCGTFRVFSLFKDDGTQCNKPVLCIKNKHVDDVWDNHEYVVDLLRDIHEDILSDKVTEFREFCGENGISYEESLVDLNKMYEQLKQLNII